MKFCNIIFFIICFSSFNLFADSITIIELHPTEEKEVNINNNQENVEVEELIIDSDDESSNQIIDSNEEVDELLFENDENNINSNESVEEKEFLNENEEVSSNEEQTEEVSSNEDQTLAEVSNESIIVSLPDYWEQSTKYDLEFLFQNLEISNSKVITSFFVDILSEFSKTPQLYTQEEFDYLRIKTLIKMGHRKKALQVLNDISTYESNKNYYDMLRLDYFLAINDLSEACSFKDSMQNISDNKKNIILKISIFCSLIMNQFEEADFLNSLLLDSKDKDEYFQKIYFNLKNNINDPVDFTQGSFDESAFALYSAMLRIGNLPFNKKFLEFDPANLSLPIILSPSTEVSLRLKSAHKAYDLGIFKAESLSALYQSVDFTAEELNNSLKNIEKYNSKPEIGMALLFQNARVQLLPITKLLSLKEFWNYSISHNFEKLAYDVSKNLIESSEPSTELSEFSLSIARAHIFNKNYIEADKWISFTQNYVVQNNTEDIKKLNNIKFLYDLQKSEDNEIFIKTLEENLIIKINEEKLLYGYNETIKTIFSIILNQKDLIQNIEDEKKVFDERIMPSKYIIDKIDSSSNTNKLGELILSTLVSLNGKSWNDVHPQHLKILLNSFSKANLNNLLKDLIIEIFEESKII